MAYHHFVPRFILKNFAGKHGRLCAYRLIDGNRSYVPVKKAACSENFYDFAISNKNISFEGRLSKLESNCARSISKIIGSENCLEINELERCDISLLLAIQSFRTSAFFEGAAVLDSSQRGITFLLAMRSSSIIQKEILTRKWLLMKIPDNQEFYIGDHPVVFQNTENPSAKGSLGFDVEGIEAFMPLTPKLALYLPHQATSSLLSDGYRNAKRLQEETNRAVLFGQTHAMANPEGLAAIRRTLISGKIFDEAFNLGRPLVASEENVINFNYLQILFSHKHVFSTQDNFGFADEVLEKNPQYRKVPDVSFSGYKSAR